MNAFTRFVVLGLQDADRRVAAALAPDILESADRHLRGSVVVSTIDGMTQRIQAWWRQSASGRLATDITTMVEQLTATERYHAIAGIALTATAVHVTLTLFNGARPGWFWMAVPAMTAGFAVLLLLGRPADGNHNDRLS